MKQLKYAWDIILEKKLSQRQLSAVSDISQMISCGGKVSRLKQKLQLL